MLASLALAIDGNRVLYTGRSKKYAGKQGTIMKVSPSKITVRWDNGKTASVGKNNLSILPSSAVNAWLTGIGMGRYAQTIIVKNGCESMASVLADIDEQALIDMGVLPFHRQVILRNITQLREEAAITVAEVGRLLLQRAFKAGGAETSDCAMCHAAPASVLNNPCFCKFLCVLCSVEFRSKAGPKCFSCDQPSQVIDTRGTLSTKKCMFCFEEWDSSHTFTAGSCFHTVCVGCATAAVRAAVGNAASWAEEDAAGVNCPMLRCKARMTTTTLCNLVRVSQDVLPDDRATCGNPERPIEALTQEEMDRLVRFLHEASIPIDRKAQCQNIPACGRIIDVPPSTTPLPHACPYCAKTICRACKKADHAGLSCEDAAAEADEAKVAEAKADEAKAAEAKANEQSIALTNATSKPCPHCGVRVTHYHGHGCHHIKPVFGNPKSGCPRCHQHFCYCCGATEKFHECTFGNTRRSWSTFCSNDAITLVILPCSWLFFSQWDPIVEHWECLCQYSNIPIKKK